MGVSRLSQVKLPDESSYNLSVPFVVGTGSTAGTWLGSLEGLTEYYDGLLILYKPSVAGATTTTLNINSLGAKTCYANNTSKLTTHFPANQPILLSYSTSQNSGCWISVNNYWDGNDTSTVRPYYTHFWAYQNGIKQYSLFAKVYTGSASNGYSSFSTNSGTETKTYDLTVPFDIRKIYYANRSSNLAASSYMGDNQVTFSMNLIDARYTLNCAKTLTANYSVYLMFDKHNDADPPGYYRLNSSIYTQTPSNQNCIYVLIGVAYDTYRVDLLMHNQAYRFNGTTLIPFNPSDVDTVNGHTVDKDVPSNADFTDNKVNQSVLSSTASAFRKIVLGNAYNATSGQSVSDITGITYVSNALEYQNSSGLLKVPKTRIANTCYGVSFDRTVGTPVETIFKTGIKWVSGAHMPVIHITGYAYGLQSPVEFKIGFYIYGDKIGYCGVTNMGSWKPTVYLFKYTRDSVNYVAVGLKGSCYFLQLQADVQDEMGKFAYTNLDDSNWSWEFLTTTGNIPTPDSGTTCIEVPYKADILKDTTYTFASGTNGFTVTPSGGTAQTVTVTPSITNNITGSGTSGSLVKFNGTNTITNGPAIGSDTTKFLNNAGSWAVPPDTKVTSSANHYTPATASGQDKTASASGASAAWSIDVVKGVTLNTDGKGHVTGLSVTSGKIPAKPSYSAADVGAIPTSSKGAANGVAELDANGLVPTSQLPSFVDDVLEYSSQSAFPATGETGKIYVALDTNLAYRWSGTAYVEISPSLALGETSSTAYRGDRGKVAYDHSQSTHARTDATAVSFTRNLTSGTKVGTITINGTGTDLYCQTNTDHYHTSGTWSNLKYTATAKNSAEELSFTLPTGTTATTVALGNHTHATTIAASTGTNQLTLAHGSKYAITAGGTSFVFTMPTDNNTDTKVSQALVSDNVNRPLLMACATNADTTATITDASRRVNTVYANASTGALTANKFNVTTNATIQYNSTTQSLDFVFA